jgi:hypothetical protein
MGRRPFLNRGSPYAEGPTAEARVSYIYTERVGADDGC